MIILQTFGGLDYELTTEQVDKIREQSTTGKNNGIWIGRDYIAFASIKDIVEIRPDVTAYPQLPAAGFNGVINSARKTASLEALIRGLTQAVTARQIEGLQSPNAQNLLDKAKLKLKLIQNQNA